MSHVLTLITTPQIAPALASLADDLRAVVGSRQPVVWLADHACDIFFEPADAAALENIRQALQNTDDAPVDVLIQPIAGRRKRMLVADMDSTIIQQECLDEIASAAGIGPQIATITERAMRGELDFEAALKERVGLLRGFAESRFQDILDTRITLTPGAETLTATMRANGGRAVLVSGGFTYFTGAIAARAGFDVHYGNRFVVENGAIAGVAEPILGRDAKLATLEREAAAAGLSTADVIAIGDGANDLAMIKAAGLGVAFHAKPIVAQQAAASVNHGDLTALLYFQGYRKDEFASPAK